MNLLPYSISSKPLEPSHKYLPVPADGGAKDEAGEGGDEVSHLEAEEIDR
jgi:hypothetical protein